MTMFTVYRLSSDEVKVYHLDEKTVNTPELEKKIKIRCCTISHLLSTGKANLTHDKEVWEEYEKRAVVGKRSVSVGDWSTILFL